MDRAAVASPKQYHRKNHRHPDVPVDDCWDCQRARAICRSKRRFATREEADAAVRDFNTSHGWAKTVTRYPCRWCPDWHMSTTRSKTELRRTERARRKALWKPA